MKRKQFNIMYTRKKSNHTVHNKLYYQKTNQYLNNLTKMQKFP